MIYCFGHCFPYSDIDSLISSVLLKEYYLLQGLEAKAVYFNEDAIRESTSEIFKLSGLEMPEFITKEGLEDENIDFAIVDHNDTMESFGFYDIDKEVLLCVDHHTIQPHLKAREIRFKKIGATCSMIADMFFDKGLKFTDQLAKGCIIGIISDTMGLRNAKTSERDREIVQYLYDNYNIDTEFDELVYKSVNQVEFRNMSIDRIISNSLREYNEGKVGIAQIFVLNNDYKERMPAILEAGNKTKYKLYIFALHIQKENRSMIYYFDKKYNIFPKYEEYDRVISRSRDILPRVLNQIKLRSTWIKNSVLLLYIITIVVK